MDLKQKLDLFNEIISKYDKACIGLSGGADSTLLCHLASKVLPVTAVTLAGDMVAEDDLRQAKSFAQNDSLKHIILNVDPFEIPGFAENTSKRCYYCKKALFSEILRVAKEQGCDVVFDGTNRDDLGDFRPGMRAIEELGVVSPFLEAGFTKADIYELNRQYNLTQKPASACLASRIKTGTPITREALKNIGKAEDELRNLGFGLVRVRSGGVFETDEAGLDLYKEKKDAVKEIFNQNGFELSEVRPYRRGSMNEK